MIALLLASFALGPIVEVLGSAAANAGTGPWTGTVRIAQLSLVDVTARGY